MEIDVESIKARSEFIEGLGEFDPRISPSLALQTYESFAGDAARKTQKDAFTNGESYHLEMTYPRLEQHEIAETRAQLTALRQKAVDRYGEGSLTVSSIDYRLLEAEFLDAAYGLNDTSKNGSEEHQRAAERYVELNEKLYGKPDLAIVDRMLGDLKRRYNTNDPRIQKLWAEVENGFTVHLSKGDEVQVPALKIKEDSEPLPNLTEDAARLLEAEWKLAFPAIVEARALLADIIAVRNGLDEAYNPTTDVLFSGRDVAHLFRMATQGIAHHHGVAPFGVIENPHGTVGAWSSAKQAVEVGAERSARMGEWTATRGTGVHESMHGLKASNGLKTNEPAMATGVYSKNPDGTFTDYLTFEEGNNKLGEQVITSKDDKEAPFNDSYNYYLLTGLFYRGYDDRQVKELAGRLLTIERLANNPELREGELESEISTTLATRIERLVRGTPATSNVTVDGHKPIYTKDIAYYKGTLVATEFWNGVAEAATSEGAAAYANAIREGANIVRAEHLKRTATRKYFHRIFEIQNQGKIDPTNTEQFAAATAAYERLAA